MYFDCLCEIGPRNAKDVAAPWSVEHVLKWMDHCGIDGALVTHTLSITNDPVSARKSLAAEIARAPQRLFPVWTMLPAHAGDFEATPTEFLDALAQADVRAVKLFPTEHGYPLAGPVVGPMLKALEMKRLLTMINIGQLGADMNTAFETLNALLTAFPKLPVLLQEHNWGMQRMILPLMSLHPNLHIEFSAYQVNRGIEDYVRRFGPERLLFGTGLPAKSAGAARAFIDYAQIPDNTKAQIAGENLSRLLGGLRPEPAPARPSDPIRNQAAMGKAITDSPVLDAHCHVLHEGANGCGRVVMIQGDAAGMAEIQDLIGIKKTAIMSWVGPVASGVSEGHEVVARTLAAYPDRYMGVIFVNLSHLEPEDVLAEVRQRVEKEGWIGLKPYHRVGLRYDDSRYTQLWEYMNEHRLYGLFHLMPAITGGAEVIGELAEKYPDAHWIVAHSGSTWQLARNVVRQMQAQPNVYAEITYTNVTNGVLEWMVSEVGDDRILFGTDSPMRDPRPQFGWVVWANLPVESRRKILGLNFQRILATRRMS